VLGVEPIVTTLPRAPALWTRQVRSAPLTTKRQREAVYRECYKHRHWMGDAPPSTPSGVTFGYVLRCNRGCGTLRHLEIDPNTGEVTGSQYEHDPRYKAYIKSLESTPREARREDANRKRRRLRAVS